VRAVGCSADGFNVKTAKSVGIAIPQPVLSWADEVMRRQVRQEIEVLLYRQS
jgi:hypothetical protein